MPDQITPIHPLLRAAIYIRVSTEEQAKEGFSIQAQLRILEAFCVLKGCTSVVTFIDERYSAKNLRRPKIRELLAACRESQFDLVVVWRLDRLSRSIRDTLTVIEDILQPNGVTLASATENIDTSTVSGRLMLNILAVFAQNERETIEERVRMVTQDLARQGRHLGGVPPLGYKIVKGQYEIDTTKAAIVRGIYARYDAGHTYSDILTWLSAEGHKTQGNRPFGKNSLHDILVNEKYNGTYVYNRTVAATKSGKRNNHASKDADEIIHIPGGIPAIIDMSTWRRVQQRMSNNQREAGRTNAKTVYLLSGIAYCGVCGKKLTIQSSGRDRNGTLQRRYTCPDRCVQRIRYEKLDHYAVEYLQTLAANPEIVQQAADLYNQMAAGEEEDRTEIISELQSQIKEIDEQLQNAIKYITTAGALAPASLIETMRELEAQKSDLQAELERTALPHTPASAEAILEALQHVAALQDAAPETQKEIIAQLVRRVVVYDDRIDVELDNHQRGGGEPSVEGQLFSLVFSFSMSQNTVQIKTRSCQSDYSKLQMLPAVGAQPR